MVDWCEELGRFLREPGEAPPDAVSDELRAFVYGDLHVDVSKLVAKTVGAFAVAATAVVAVCPQLGVGPWLSDWALAVALGHVLHALGPWICAAVCGALFVGWGTLASVVVLRRAELRWVYRRRARAALVLAMTGLFALAMLGGSSTGDERFFWLLGALGAAGVVLETLGRLRLPRSARRALPAT
jgi:hypothetical protein